MKSKSKIFIGIDLAKEKFDVSFFDKQQENEVHYQQFQNTIEGCNEMIAWISNTTKQPKGQWLFCAEHTGIYGYTLTAFLISEALCLWIENPLQIKLSKGIQRGKNDKIDSRVIAQYACRFEDKKKLVEATHVSIEKLKDLASLRERIVKAINQFKVPLKELKKIKSTDTAVMLTDQCSERILKTLEEELLQIENEIQKVIKGDSKIQNTFDLICSVKGVGAQTALTLIIHTNCFEAFKTVRQLACYSGIAPFDKSSGSSLRGKTKVSHLANKKLKSLLNMCAISALQHDPEMRQYFERKIAQGKHKMSVINAIRNKILYRIFASVRDNRKYMTKEDYVAYRQAS